MRTILKYIKPYALRMTWGLFIKFTGTIMDLFLPYILAHIIDDIVPTGELKRIYLWGGIMIFCAAVGVTNNIIANRAASLVARNMTQKLRYDLFSKICRLSCSDTDKFTIPSLVSRLTSDTYNVNRMVTMMQRLGVRAPILLIGGIIVTMTLEPVLTSILIIILPILGVIVFAVSKKGIPLYKKVSEKVDGLVRTVQENIVGIRVIKALSKTDYEKERFGGINKTLAASEKKAAMVMGISNPMMNLLLNTGLTFVVILGAFRVNAGVTQPGKIIAFLSYFTIILQAMMTVTRMFVMYSKGAASADRIAEVLTSPDSFSIGDRNHTDNGCHISFEHVSFSYNKVENNLTDIDFSLKKGQTLGIIGATGSGKTTVISLLMRLYDISEGCIRIDGDDIRGIPFEELYTKFGVVFQNDFLLADTVRENISFERQLTEEEIKSGAENAQADFIYGLSGGFDFKLAIKGQNLSGGQKQRLLIARALAKKPEILILDDSSSALDYKTDASLRHAIKTGYGGITTIIIAQRISSVKGCDLILMLDEGRIIGMGTHEELLGNCPEYREILDNQMGE